MILAISQLVKLVCTAAHRLPDVFQTATETILAIACPVLAHQTVKMLMNVTIRIFAQLTAIALIQSELIIVSVIQATSIPMESASQKINAIPYNSVRLTQSVPIPTAYPHVNALPVTTRWMELVMISTNVLRIPIFATKTPFATMLREVTHVTAYTDSVVMDIYVPKWTLAMRLLAVFISFASFQLMEDLTVYATLALNARVTCHVLILTSANLQFVKSTKRVEILMEVIHVIVHQV